MKKINIQKIFLSALFLSLGLVLPIFTSQIKEIGDTLLPMHIPVMLCGILCGGWFGLGVGILTPLLRAAIFSMPPLYPNACWMALELATYGCVVGFLYNRAKRKNLGALYLSLGVSMIAGRIVWGLAKALLLGFSGKSFTAAAFVTGGFIDALPGIILQFILIPAVVKTVETERIKG